MTASVAVCSTIGVQLHNCYLSADQKHKAVKCNCPSKTNCFLKVRQIQNDFFKPTFLPKNEQTNSTLLLVDYFWFGFFEESEDTEKTF